jgi:hypothetical protein
MKLLAKLLLIAAVGATVILVWRENWSSTSKRQTPAKVTATPLRTTVSSSALNQTERSQTRYEPQPDTTAQLHSLLRSWKRSETNDPDDEEGRDKLLKTMLATLTDGNVAEIIQSLSADEMNTPFGIGALHRWMKVDPIATSNWLASRQGTTEEQTFAVANDWIGNRDSLQQYLDQLPDTAWRQDLLAAAGSVLSVKEPVEAIKLAEQMKPSDAQTNLLKSVACAWVDTDPVAALDWVASVNDPQLREPLIASALQSYALADPRNAATWLVSDIKSSGVAKDAALNILATWVTKSPADAADWVSLFPDGDIKVAAVQVVSSYWHQTDPAATAAWIQKLSTGPAVATH